MKTIKLNVIKRKAFESSIFISSRSISFHLVLSRTIGVFSVFFFSFILLMLCWIIARVKISNNNELRFAKRCSPLSPANGDGNCCPTFYVIPFVIDVDWRMSMNAYERKSERRDGKSPMAQQQHVVQLEK